MKQWHFYDRVYRRWVVLLIGDYDSFRQEVEDQGYKHMDDIRDAKGMCVELDADNNSAGQYCTMVWLKKYEMTTLIHEITHLVMICFDQVGVPIGRDDTEAFAFYAEYWYTEITRVRRKFPQGRAPHLAKR